MILPSFTYSSFDPRDNQSLQRAAHFMVDYIKNHGGSVIYTDFDEHVGHLDAKYDLSEAMSGPIDAKEDFNKLLAWSQTLTDAEAWG